MVRRYLALAPHDAKLRRQFFVLLDALGLRDALTEQVALLGRDPLADAGLVATAARLLARRGERDEARRMLTEIVERAPEDPWALAHRGQDGWIRRCVFWGKLTQGTGRSARDVTMAVTSHEEAFAWAVIGAADYFVTMRADLTQSISGKAC